jgi:3-oxoadipyl-CoA thiolase
MPEAFICDAVRTPIGRYGGALAGVRPDDLLAGVLKALMERNAGVDWTAVDDVVVGCANQAGEDNRSVARMSLLLAGLPETISGSTVNRLCGSGMEAVATASRWIKTGEGDLLVAGGVESMSRAPFVLPKTETPYGRGLELYDTTLGWRFVNKQMETMYGVESLGETAENVADEYNVSREDQDAFALRSQQRAKASMASGRLAKEIVPVSIPQRRGDPVVVDKDEHPRDTTIESLAALAPAFRKGGSVTAGNASGINDGACAMIVASEEAARRNGLRPRARIVAATTAGVPPRVMGMGPVPAVRKLVEKTGVSIGDVDVVELNEAFASQSLACLRELGLPDDGEHVNPNGGAIALGHPLGMSGARLVTTATYELQEREGRYAVTSMCIGVGQGIAMLLERV